MVKMGSIMVCSRREIPATALALPLRLHPGLHHHSLRLPPHRIQGTGHPGTRNPGAGHPGTRKLGARHLDVPDIQAPGSLVPDTYRYKHSNQSFRYQDKGTRHPGTIPSDSRHPGSKVRDHKSRY